MCITMLMLVVASLLAAEASSSSSSSSSSSTSADWWIESSLVRIFPTTTPARSNVTVVAGAKISLAGNEHESFQLGLRLPSTSPNTSYAVSINADDDDDQIQITWEHVGWVYVPEIAPNSQSSAGWWPDPLLRVPKVLATSGETSAVWFTVHAPTQQHPARPTTYMATITLTADNAAEATAEAETIAFEVEVTVFGFNLPRRPALKTAINLDESKLGQIYGSNSTKTNTSLVLIETMWNNTGCTNPFSKTEGEWTLWEQDADGGATDMYSYCDLTLHSKASPGQLAVCGSAKQCTLQHLPGRGGGYNPAGRPGHAHFVEWSHWLLTNFSFSPGTIYSPPVPFTVDELLEMVPLGLNSFTAFPARPEYANDTAIAKYVQELDANNLSQYATTYGYDESDLLDEMEATFRALKAAYPSIKTFTTAHMCGSRSNWQQPFSPCYGTCPGPHCRNGTTGQPVQDPVQIKRRNIDYMCPILDWVQPSNMTECEDSGLEMWMYTSLEPFGKYANLRLDNNLFEPRLLFWQVAQLRLTGYLYWDLNAWESTSVSHKLIDGASLTSPYISPKDWTPMQTEGKIDVGDGKLVYGGTDGPIGSIRLAAVRDGIEDFGYLALLKEAKSDAAVQEVIAKVATPGNLQQHIGGSPEELKLFMAQRTAIAEVLQVQSKPLSL